MDLLTLYRDDGPVVQTLARAGGDGASHHRLAWLLPAIVRVGEYGLVLWLGWQAEALPATFALLAALAYRHYDLVYRMRYQQVPPPAWLALAGLGWDGRAAVLAAAAFAGVYGPVAAALACWCAVLFVGESVVGWVRAARDPATVAAAVADDEE